MATFAQQAVSRNSLLADTGKVYAIRPGAYSAWGRGEAGASASLPTGVGPRVASVRRNRIKLDARHGSLVRRGQRQLERGARQGNLGMQQHLLVEVKQEARPVQQEDQRVATAIVPRGVHRCADAINRIGAVTHRMPRLRRRTT